MRAFGKLAGKLGPAAAGVLLMMTPVRSLAAPLPVPLWSSVSPLPTSRWGSAVGVINGKIYVVAGWNDPATAVNTCEEYSPPPADTWATMTPSSLPLPRIWTAGGVINNLFYVVGGFNGVAELGTNEAFDPTAGPGGSWTAMTDMPTPRDSMAVAVVNGKLYAIGGWDGSVALNVVEEYDPTAGPGGSWTTMTPMPSIRELAAVAVVNNKIYVIGGDDGAVFLDTVEVFDPAAGPGGSWSSKTAMPDQVDTPEAAVVNGRIWVLGGIDAGGVSAKVFAYDPVADAWTASVDLPAPLAYPATATVNSRLYALGGMDASYVSTGSSYEGQWAEFNTAAAVAPSVTITGTMVTVTLTVTNAGGADATGVAPTLGEAVGSGLVVPDSGPLPAGPQTVPAAGSLTFTWTFTTTGGGGPVTFSESVDGIDAATGLAVSGQAFAPLTLLVPARLDASLALTANPAATGSVVTVALTVTNTGSFNATGVSATLVNTSGPGLLPYRSGPVPSGTVTIASGGAVTFVWTYTANGASVDNFTATATGTDSWAGGGLSATAYATLTVMPPFAVLSSALAVVPPLVAPGQWARLVLTVTNSGTASATLMLPSYVANAGAASATVIGAGPVPAGPVTIPPGTSAAFTWTLSASGFGTLAFTVSVAGTDAGTGGLALATRSGSLGVGPPAVFAATVRLVPASTTVFVGQTFDVELTVTNTGGLPAANVIPALLPVGGAGTVALLMGPVPPVPLSLAPGAATTYVWTFDALTDGPITATVFVSGWNGVSATVVAGSGVGVTLLRPGKLVATLQAYPAIAVTAGLPVQVTLTVSNTGQVPVFSASVYLASDAGPGSLLDVSGPVPPGPVTLAGGGSQRFTWNYTASITGSVEVTATAMGTDTGLGVAVLGATSLTETVKAPAALLCTWKLSTTNVDQGRTFTEQLSVSNTGNVDAWNVTPPAFLVIAPGWRATQTAAPSPAARAILPPGISQKFTYTFQATATGFVDFSATVTAQDSGTLAALTSSAFSSTVLVTAAAVLTSAAAVTPAGSIRPGAPFVFAFTVTNTGAADANLPVPTLGLSDGTLARIDGAPVSATLIAAGASLTYVWQLTALSGGSLTLSGSLSATNAGNGQQVSTTASAAAVILPRPDGEIAVYPNPASGDLLHVSLHLAADATRVSLDVYDASMRRVFTGAWGAVQAVDGTLDIAGVRAWAPGIYLVRAVATYADNTTRTFPIAKLKVKR